MGEPSSPPGQWRTAPSSLLRSTDRWGERSIGSAGVGDQAGAPPADRTGVGSHGQQECRFSWRFVADPRTPGPPGGHERRLPVPVVLLDPTTAYRTKLTGSTCVPSTFVSGALLVRGRHAETWAALEAATKRRLGGVPFVEGRDRLGRDLLRPCGPGREAVPRGCSIRPVGSSGSGWRRTRRARDAVFRPLDTWRLLQSYRAGWPTGSGAASRLSNRPSRPQPEPADQPYPY